MVNATLPKLVDAFGSEQKCREYLQQLRWPDGVKCPRCQSPKISRVAKRSQFDCDSCRYQFSVTAGTIFHDSHLPLWKWFLAIYMMGESRKGISANQLKRTLGVSYKTAWFLCHRIRAAMHQAGTLKLSGIVEVDETYIGGRKRGIGSGNYRKHKALVVGGVQRGGPILLKVIERANKRTLHKFIREATDPKARAIYTDEAEAYKGIDDRDTKHESVNHAQDEWVRADVHTNTVEGVWSLFKRSIVGSYHQLSAKHLPRYLDEMAFRFNNRRNPFLFRDTLKRLLGAAALPYSRLVEESK